MDQHMIRVVLALCEDVGTPVAHSVMELAKAGEYAKLQQLRVRPSDYTDPEVYFADLCCVELLRKCDLPSGVDKVEAAVRTFWECENQNARTNVRLSRFLEESLFMEDPSDGVIYEFIREWRKEIKFVLGRLPDSLVPRFGKGSTFADVGDWITIPDKMSSRPTVTLLARDLLPLWWDCAWARALITERPWQSDPKTIRGNRFTTVPKDGLKHRGICVEPSINISLQLDVGRLIKQRLLRIGIDLYKGQSRHRLLAQAASVLGHLCTIDLSNASDTLSRVLVALLLPPEWYSLLDSLRSPSTQLNGKWVRLEKFSSMGNGFTFELETLLFATLGRVVSRKSGCNPDDVSCYGDDIIAPIESSRDLMAALRYFGFTPNEKKTFVEGPFRESCGGDFFNGVPVRAHYLEELPNEPQQWISLANGLRRAAFSVGHHDRRWKYLRRAWRRAQDPIPGNIRRCKGPTHLGDVVIHDHETQWSIVYDEGSTLRNVRTYEPVPSVLPWNNWNPAVHLASALTGLPSRGVTPRGGVAGWRFGRQVCDLTSTWLPRDSDTIREERVRDYRLRSVMLQ